MDVRVLDSCPDPDSSKYPEPEPEFEPESDPASNPEPDELDPDFQPVSGGRFR